MAETKKKILILPLVLVILVCSLAVPVSAETVSPGAHRFVMFEPGDVYCRVLYAGEWDPETRKILVDDFNLVRDCTTVLSVVGLQEYPVSSTQVFFTVYPQIDSGIFQNCYRNTTSGNVVFWNMSTAPIDSLGTIYVCLLEAGDGGRAGYYYPLLSADGVNFWSTNQTAMRVAASDVELFTENPLYEDGTNPPTPELEPTISDLDKEKDEAQNAGDELTGELVDVIPDYSDDIGQALGSLVTALSYDGTEAVLVVPSWTFPQIGNMIPERVIWNQMEVDLGEYINMLPPDILLLVQSLLTAALILYCFYELYATVGLILMPKGGVE